MREYQPPLPMWIANKLEEHRCVRCYEEDFPRLLQIMPDPDLDEEGIFFCEGCLKIISEKAGEIQQIA